MEVLGLVEAIISTISESPRQVFAKNKAVINVDQVIDMLEKLKVILHRGGDFAKDSVTVDSENVVKKKSVAETNPELFGLEGEALLRQAKNEADKMKENADKYAENVLTNLQVVVTKMMRNIENGKDRLTKYKGDE